jgi:hypothetical protein
VKIQTSFICLQTKFFSPLFANVHEHWLNIIVFPLLQTQIQDLARRLLKMRHLPRLLSPHDHKRKSGQRGLIRIHSGQMWIASLFCCARGVGDGVGLNESCEEVNSFLHFIDFELFAEMKEQN